VEAVFDDAVRFRRRLSVSQCGSLSLHSNKSLALTSIFLVFCVFLSVSEKLGRWAYWKKALPLTHLWPTQVVSVFDYTV
jgi:hypothetical protein